MNHMPFTDSPRFSAMPPSAAAPRIATPIQIAIAIGRGIRFVSFLGIAALPPGVVSADRRIVNRGRVLLAP